MPQLLTFVVYVVCAMWIRFTLFLGYVLSYIVLYDLLAQPNFCRNSGQSHSCSAGSANVIGCAPVSNHTAHSVIVLWTEHASVDGVILSPSQRCLKCWCSFTAVDNSSSSSLSTANEAVRRSDGRRTVSAQCLVRLTVGQLSHAVQPMSVPLRSRPSRGPRDTPTTVTPTLLSRDVHLLLNDDRRAASDDSAPFLFIRRSACYGAANRLFCVRIEFSNRIGRIYHASRNTI